MASSIKNKMRVVLTGDIDLTPHALLKRGEKGRVTAITHDAEGLYQAEVRMDKLHPGLAAWNNEALFALPELLSVARAPSVLQTVCRAAVYVVLAIIGVMARIT